MKDVLTHEDMAVGSYRFPVNELIPQMTRVALQTHKKDSESRVRTIVLRLRELQQNHRLRLPLRRFKSPLLDRFYGALLKHRAAAQQLG